MAENFPSRIIFLQFVVQKYKLQNIDKCNVILSKKKTSLFRLIKHQIFMLVISNQN